MKHIEADQMADIYLSRGLRLAIKEITLRVKASPKDSNTQKFWKEVLDKLSRKAPKK